MKKILLMATLTVACMVGFNSCGSDKDEVIVPNVPSVPDLEQNYFSIQDASYSAGDIPTATTTETITGVTMNNQGMANGANFVQIASTTVYEEFYIGVEGVDGYWRYVPENVTSRADDTYHRYIIPFVYSENFGRDINVIISGKDGEGKIYDKIQLPVKFVESQSGDLNINLTFSNEKDVDLYLILPDETTIYYGNKGGSYELEDGDIITYGLDHDSNAGCNIDGLKNENIFLPTQLIQSGTYTVLVDMYRNCDRNIATDWMVVVRYKGSLIPNELEGYGNPASGTYPIGAIERDMTPIMKFTLSGTRTSLSPVKLDTFKPFELTEMDWMKMHGF